MQLVLTIVIILIAAVFIIVPLTIYRYRKMASRRMLPEKGTNLSTSSDQSAHTPTNPLVSLLTDKGEILIELYQDLTPSTVANFVHLIEKHFYHGIPFHRVEPWVIQCGDMAYIGKENVSWSIPLEINRQIRNKKYSVGMARLKEANSANTQFYILKNNVKSLDDKFTVFGRVRKGQQVVHEIKKGDRIIETKILLP